MIVRFMVEYILKVKGFYKQVSQIQCEQETLKSLKTKEKVLAIQLEDLSKIECLNSDEIKALKQVYKHITQKITIIQDAKILEKNYQDVFVKLYPDKQEKLNKALKVMLSFAEEACFKALIAGRLEIIRVEEQKNHHEQVLHCKHEMPELPFFKRADIFNVQEYNKLFALMDFVCSIEYNGSAVRQACNLIIMFGNVEAALKYCQACMQEGRMVHDACLFSLPADKPEWDIMIWRKIAQKKDALIKNQKFRECVLPRAGVLEQYFKDQAYNMQFATLAPVDTQFHTKNLNEAWNIYVKNKTDKHFSHFLDQIPMSCWINESAKRTFKKSEKNMAAALLFHKVGLTQKEFDEYLHLKPKDSDHIPNEVIDGRVIDTRIHFYIKKLDPYNAKAACLGRLTDCCQSLGFEGAVCAKYGIESEHSGFYVICEGKADNMQEDDKIVAQTWCWKSRREALVFDSIEYLREKGKAKVPGAEFTYLQGWVALFQKLAQTLIKKYNHISRVVVGAGGATPANMGFMLEGRDHFMEHEHPIDFTGYRDSRRRQVILAMQDFPLAELYVVSHFNDNNFLLDQTQEAISKKTVIEYLIAAGEKANKLIWGLISQCTPNIMVLNVVYHYYALSPEAIKTNFKRVSQFIWERDLWLRLAIASGKSEYVLFLQEQGISLHEKWKVVDTPLYMAIRSGQLSMVQWLVKQGISLSQKFQEEDTVLHKAVYHGHLEIVRWLIEVQQFELGYCNQEENTALHIALQSKKWNILQYLIQKIADNNRQDVFELKNKQGQTILHAMMERFSQCRQMDIERSQILEAIQYCAERGLCLNHQNENGNTVLHCLIDLRYVKAVLDLLKCCNQHDTLLDLKNKTGQTILHKAVLIQSMNLLMNLVQVYKINLDIQDNDGNTALYLAAKNCHWEMLRCLMQQGANCSIKAEKILYYIVFHHEENKIKWETVKSFTSLAAFNSNTDDARIILDQIKALRQFECHAFLEKGADDCKSRFGRLLN